MNTEERLARLERLLLQAVRIPMGHGGMQNEGYLKIEEELAPQVPQPGKPAVTT